MLNNKDRLKKNINILNTHNKRHVLHLTGGQKQEIDLIDEIVEDVSLVLEKIENQTLVEFPCEVGERIWVIEREDGDAVDISCVMFLAKSKNCIIASSWINDYDIDETIEYHIEETSNNFGTELFVYPDEDCFVTKDEAEAKLKGLNGNVER